MCPYCGEDRQLEWSPTTRTWTCGVCAKSWHPPARPRRWVPGGLKPPPARPETA